MQLSPETEEDFVILVDEFDRELGVKPKLAAHREGVLHRAISVLISNSKGELLLQRRAGGKYHSPGLWTNTCCSHPRPEEETEDAARRRLFEEMGIRCYLRYRYTFLYRALFPDGLIEHELDHVFTGECDDVPAPDAGEVGEWRYALPRIVLEEMNADPGRYTVWFRLIMNRLYSAES